MNHQVKPTVLHHIETGETHHLPHPLTVTRRVAMSLAFFTHRLGVIGALEKLGDAVLEQLVAVRTHGYFFLVQALA